MKKLILLLSILLTSCENPKDVEKYAKMEDWQSYEITGTCWLSCGKNELFRTEFDAIKNGRHFSGCVCSGIFKGSTLRLD